MGRKSCRLSVTPETVQSPGHVQSVQALPFTTWLSQSPGKLLGFSGELRVWRLSKHRFSMVCPLPSCPWSFSPSRHFFWVIMELSLRLSPNFPIHKVRGIFPLYSSSTNDSSRVEPPPQKKKTCLVIADIKRHFFLVFQQ